MPRLRVLTVLPLCGAVALWIAGCQEKPSPAPSKPAATKEGAKETKGEKEHDHDGHDHAGHDHEGHDHKGHDHGEKGGHHHAEFGPHKGTLIVFGHEDLHLELVLDSKTGTLTAYPLDDKAEKPVALDQDAIELSFTARTDPKSKEIPTPYALTLKKAEGDEEKYVGQSDDLKGKDKFDGAFLPVKTKAGKEFEETKFKFPEGNHEH